MFLLKKRLITLLLCLLCAITLLLGILGLNNKTSQAYTASQGGTLGTLYNISDGYFEKDTLNAIAQATGSYSDINALITDITTNNKTIRASVFGTKTVYFGTNGNTGEALEWTPVYVSKDTDDNSILTLWLSYNATAGNQEVSAWSDGTYSNSTATKSWTENGTTSAIYSNTYDGSYIRNYVLNGRTTYTTAWGTLTSISVPAASDMKKFSQFVSGGDLASYIVTPSKVSWQMAESTYRNDPSFSGKANYPNNWTNDNLWLPSLTETGTNGTNGTWRTTVAQCANTTLTWLRSGDSSRYANSDYLLAAGSSYSNFGVHNPYGVRPAIHLNLSKAAQNMSGPVDPQDVSAAYNGNALTIADVAAADKSWYDSNEVTLSYFSDINCTVSATPKDAGDYYIKVTLIDPTTTRFKNDTTATAQGWKAVKFTVIKKKLSVTVTDSDSDGVPDKVTYDPTEICAGDSPPNFEVLYGTAIGSGSSAPPTATGTYYATASITDTTSNYEIDTSTTTYYTQFTVKAGVVKPYFASGSAGTVTDTAKYTGSALDFPLYGLSSDVTLTPATSGITFDSTNNKLTVTGGVNTYTVTVALADTATHQWQGGGTSSYTLTVTITKGDYDFSNVKWQYQNSSGNWVDFPVGGLTYTGNNVTLNVTGLPSGLSVLSTNYTGNSNTNAGSYTAQVTALNGLDTTNYNTVNLSALSQFTLSYTINKVQVPLSWSTTTQTVDGNAVIIPTLPTNAAYTVVYYDASDFDTTKGEPKAGATELTLSGLTYNDTSLTTYYAYAKLSSNVVYQNNYELTGTKYNSFKIGGGKTAVLVTLDSNSMTYDGTAFSASATATFTDGSTAGIQLTYSYFASDGVTPISAPTDAGSYCVKIDVATINANDYVISGTSLFAFTIDKVDVDLTGFGWNYTAPFEYERDDNGVVTHSVAPIMPNNLPTIIENALKGALGGTFSSSEKGTYKATADIATALSDAAIQKNYNVIMPSNFPDYLDWKVEERNIAMPVFDGSWTEFDGDDKGHDLAKLCGLPDDWQYYLDITVKITLPDGSTVTKTQNYGYDAGDYEVTFTVKNGINTGNDFNVWIGNDDTQTVKFTVAQKAVTVSGWKGTGTKAQAQFAEDGVLSEWYTYAVYDDNGNVAVPDASGKYPAGNYTRKVVPTTQNIRIVNDSTQCVQFNVDDNGDETNTAVYPNGVDDGTTPITKGSGTGCNKVNWLMIVCILLTLFVIVYYLLIIRIIHRRRAEADDEADDDGEYSASDDEDEDDDGDGE